MTDEELEKIVREYIDKTLHMSLATVSDNRPWVCEVHFVYDEDLNLFWRSLASRRHSQEIAANPHVAGNIVRQHGPGEYPHAIYFEGRAEQIDDAEVRKSILPYFTARSGLGEEILVDAANPDGHQFYKATIENWYAFGKFGQDSGNKYQLKWNESE